MTDALHIADGYSARPYGDGYIIHHESGGAWAADLAMVAAVREIARLRALAAPAVPPRGQFVPVEPTPAMRRAAVESREGRAVYKVTSKASLEALEDIAADDYRAMLAAAPTAQQEPKP